MEKHPRGYRHISGDIQVIVPLWSVLVFKLVEDLRLDWETWESTLKK